VENGIESPIKWYDGIPVQCSATSPVCVQCWSICLKQRHQIHERGEVVTSIRFLFTPEPRRWPFAVASAFSQFAHGHRHRVGSPGAAVQTFRAGGSFDGAKFGGTGLGLTISNGLVELMGSNMWGGKASPQRLDVPISVPLAQSAAASPARAGVQPQLANLRLLIVDDQPRLPHLTLQASKWGMIPRTAASAAQPWSI